MSQIPGFLSLNSTSIPYTSTFITTSIITDENGDVAYKFTTKFMLHVAIIIESVLIFAVICGFFTWYYMDQKKRKEKVNNSLMNLQSNPIDNHPNTRWPDNLLSLQPDPSDNPSPKLSDVPPAAATNIRSYHSKLYEAPDPSTDNIINTITSNTTNDTEGNAVITSVLPKESDDIPPKQSKEVTHKFITLLNSVAPKPDIARLNQLKHQSQDLPETDSTICKNEETETYIKTRRNSAPQMCLQAVNAFDVHENVSSQQDDNECAQTQDDNDDSSDYIDGVDYSMTESVLEQPDVINVVMQNMGHHQDNDESGDISIVFQD